MPAGSPMVLATAGGAALASVLGGLVAIWWAPTTLFMSSALGLASGVLLATVFEMLSQSVEMIAVPLAAGSVAGGFLVVYGFDLFMHRGKVAGAKAEQHEQVARFHRRHRLRGRNVAVLAGGTSVEEIVEGLSIGVGTVIRPELGILVALAILVDNFSEGLGIGELIRADPSPPGRQRRRILGWTALIGVNLFVSAVVGWFLLHSMSQALLGCLFAAGAGAMLYLTVTGLVPQAEERHYQQSSALAMAAGFLLVFVLSHSM